MTLFKGKAKNISPISNETAVSKRLSIRLYLIIDILAFAIFCFTYGVRILNPVYIDWLLTQGADSAQHFIGWEV